MADEHAGEVGSSQLGGTSTDLSKFEALTLHDGIPHTTESADRIDSGMLDSTTAKPLVLEDQKPSEIPRKYLPPKFLGTIISEERQAEREFAERQLQARGQCRPASKEEIARNAKKCMSEDVMVAFRRYIKREDDLKGIEYEFEELLHECLNMDNYFKIFHHFNFTVKIKKCGSADWTPMTFFAEVILILQTKFYECYSLDPDDYGQCYACQKQGMRELRHPSADIFECGKRDTTFPYYYKDSDTTFPYYYEDIDSDESYPIVGGSESDCDMS